MHFLDNIRNFDFRLFIDYFLSSYYTVSLIIAIGLYLFIDTVKHPTKNGWDSSPSCRENKRSFSWFWVTFHSTSVGFDLYEKPLLQ